MLGFAVLGVVFLFVCFFKNLYTAFVSVCLFVTEANRELPVIVFSGFLLRYPEFSALAC